MTVGPLVLLPAWGGAYSFSPPPQLDNKNEEKMSNASLLDRSKIFEFFIFIKLSVLTCRYMNIIR